ncbi:hypothetical protein HBI56_192710 [Parastagonospora nodorum]|uniref:3'-5' exonuclease domain-containing protein n=1 Tax=Phaeosphaeria nodorum (strain SN15 / ATCC MYA-4574 / FGSC 10173) TaxID=321614 RepID=A0A7U2NPX9_PHANO|nr:hypothetical protein HBH56_177620 [Parastagonospora nodorum]QRD06088.1 hypothetical protein JI435_146570 [Parastagonospora nodorum SN15]KAH3932007.1 hypothetical protein HBH54_092190 [Parastagonospora nodorum]KAH3939571.1 hypothetical protein HBH53_232230 [Parastagonospora nodorum]KAH3964318.1 hypothetical protein HBH52_211530 [Parastagonospora nodorum]
MNQPSPEIIDTTLQVSALVDWLQTHHNPSNPSSPIIYLDLEGVPLSRSGSISILTIFLPSSARIFLIDMHTLGALAFTTPSSQGKTLKHVLEDSQITKVFFDVRNDSDALYAHYGVALQCVEDVQLMESAAREKTALRRTVIGLARCVEKNCSATSTWQAAKSRGEKLFKPELGGSYEVFNQRPIPADIVAYCAGDVGCLVQLREVFCQGKGQEWRDLVRDEAGRRVAESQRADYRPHGREKALAPWKAEQNARFDELNGEGVYDERDDATSWGDCVDDWDIGFYDN